LAYLFAEESQMSVDGKVVAVTGVTAGIGRTVARVFAERGCRVVGCGRRSDRGLSLEEKIREAGGRFTFVQADVTSRDECRQFIDAAVSEHGRIDVLINNAGGSGQWTTIDELEEKDFDEILRLNLHSALFCSQRAIEHMCSSGDGGVILNVASVHAVLAVARTGAYNAAKAGLVQLTKTIAIEFIDRGIRANAIVMGGALTPLSADGVRQVTKIVKGADADPDFSQTLPRSLTGTPLRDIATAMVALADDDAVAITGAEIAIDQGQTAGSLYSEAIFHALSGGWTTPK
jgi:NAD(P)-dependent dehydrogenase (short-subunit alcohol dehydrogenase family)